MPLGDNIKFKKRRLFTKTEPVAEETEETTEEKEEPSEDAETSVATVESEIPETPLDAEETESLDEGITDFEELDREKGRHKRVFSSRPYLLFGLEGSLYGFEAHVVREIFRLPEVTPIDEAPEYILGVVNLRGKIVPIMDLNLRLGHEQLEPSIDDSVIVLEISEDGFMVGVVVNEVRDVITVRAEQMEEVPFHQGQGYSQLIDCDAKIGDNIVMLLDYEKLILEQEYVEALISGDVTQTQKQENEKREKNGRKKRRVFFPNATKEERKILKERAKNLMASMESEDRSGLLALAVFGLNGEYFGIDLDVVREFSDLSNITPIPCCPEHIVGSINLRGDILTLVDIRKALKMPQVSTENLSKVIVLYNKQQVGVPVDNVYDIIYIPSSEITPIPAAVQSVSDEYLDGTAPYQDKMLSIIDIRKIFDKGDMTVEEEV
jgi:purine-binding chemotaxis protein CheW